MTNIHIDLRRITVEDWLTISGQEKLKQRAMDILDGWERLLLNNLDNYCWASPSFDRHSLVYVPKEKRRGERYFPDYRKMISYLMRYFK
jgi:hypothetical protein